MVNACDLNGKENFPWSDESIIFQSLRLQSLQKQNSRRSCQSQRGKSEVQKMRIKSAET